MSCPRATHGRHKRRINFLLTRPATLVARHSTVLRRHLDNHGYVTPNFSWAEMADTGGTRVPANLRHNAVRHCWNLERFSRALGIASKGRVKRVSITINGPYRTATHNVAVHGAIYSQHLQADATDHFKTQVNRWCREANLKLLQVIAIAERYFTAIGNENSGTLHLDSRPGRAGSIRFTTWVGAR